MNDAIQVLRQEGAVLVDPANIPSIVDGTPANNLLLFPSCTTRAANRFACPRSLARRQARGAAHCRHSGNGSP